MKKELEDLFQLKRNWVIWRNSNSARIEFYLLSDEVETSEDLFERDNTFILGDHLGADIKAFDITKSKVLDFKVLEEFRPNINEHSILLPDSKWELTFQNSVEKALIEFENGELEKVVLSAKSVYASKMHPMQVFVGLLKRYLGSNCFLFFIKGEGVWLGASPEKLFIKNQNEVELMALAATRSLALEVWTEKEKREQAIVANKMLRILREANFQNIKTEGPFNKSNGEIEHLCTLIGGRTNEKSNWFELLRTIHPSAALAGSPKKLALDFIAENEQHDRELFTGFFGFIHEQKADITIIIRCAKCRPDKYELFAGAGINSGSIPINEVVELKQKFNIVLSVIDQS